jgi:hypothetical protein
LFLFFVINYKLCKVDSWGFSIFDGADIRFATTLEVGVDVGHVVNFGDDVDFGHF